MNPQHRKVPSVRRPNRPEGLFECDWIAGGAKAALIADILSRSAAFVGAFDNAFEIDLLRQKYSDSRFHTFSMGEGHTTWSLHATSEEGMRNASYLTANTDVGVGLGARIANAFREAEILVRSEGFLAMLESLPDEVQTATGSCLKYIVANFYYSLSGAVGAAIIPVVAPPILRVLAKFGVVVNAHFYALGPDTFAGVSKRARKTAASALTNNVRMILDRTLIKVPSTLELHNLPPFQDDLRSRNQLLLLDSIASHCVQLEHYRNMDTPNHANTNRLGTITSKTVDYLLGLDRIVDIAGQVASSFFKDVMRRLTRTSAAMHLLINEQWIDESRERKREDVEDILDRFDIDDSTVLLEAITKPAFDHYYQWKLMTRSHGEFLLEQLSTRFATTIRSAQEFEDRLELIATFERKLQIEFDEIVELEVQLSVAIDGVTADFHLQLQQLKDAHPSKGEKNLETLTNTATDLRQLSDRNALLIAEKNTVERSQAVVDREKRIHHARIERLLTTLDSHVPKGESLSGESAVAITGFDEAFPTLLNLPDLTFEEQRSELCGLAASISLSGLQRCVFANDTQFQTIAKRIVEGPYSIHSPGHGGRIQPSSTDELWYLCPPQQPEHELGLATEIRVLQPKARVLFYDRLNFGAAVMRIRIQRFSRLREIFSNLIEADLIDAVRDPLARLNSPDNFKALDDLGIRIDGDHLDFDDDNASPGLVQA